MAAAGKAWSGMLLLGKLVPLSFSSFRLGHQHSAVLTSHSAAAGFIPSHFGFFVEDVTAQFALGEGRELEPLIENILVINFVFKLGRRASKG